MTKSESKLGSRNPMFGKPAWNRKEGERYPSGSLKYRKPGITTQGSPEHKEKLSLIHTGKKKPWVSERNKAHPYWLSKKRPAMDAENNPVWSGGGDKYWQRQALIRDDYTCQKCGVREPDIMEVDHIIPKSVAPELRHELNNLVTLCPNDHRRKTNREKKAIRRALQEIAGK